MAVRVLRAGPRAGRPSSVDPAGTTTLPLSATLNGSYSWIARGSICTDGDTQYAVWVDENRKARIARRAWRQGWSSAVDLSAASGSAFSAAFTLDSHNTITVAVSTDGYIHVAGDMHAVALKYMRSSAPNTITGSWTTTMVGSNETSATYPQFIKAKNGTLFFFYRDGTSGDGNWLLNRYSAATGTWSRVATIMQGATDNNSAYPTDITVNRSTGRWHMWWTIRNQPNAGPQDNTDIYYGYSDDDGTTWRNTAGTAYTLPITKATGEKIVTHAGGTTETILNPHQGASAVDSSGNPHALFLIADSGGIYRYRHFWHNGSVWVDETLLPTTNAAARRPDIVCFADGRSWMIFQTSSGGRGSTLRYYDIDSQVEGVLRDVDMLHYEPAVEYSHQRDVLYVMAPYERTAGAIGGDPVDLGSQVAVPVLAVR